MIEITKQITVDLARKGDTRIIFATQNDQNSRKILINLTDGGRAYPVPQSVAAIVNIARPDGETGAVPAQVMENGSVLLTLGLWALSIEGELKCSVSIFDGDDQKLTSAIFYIDVQGTLYTGDDVIEDENYSLLSNILSEAVKLNGEEKKRIDAESKRQQYENLRVFAENTREANETNRKAAEASRISGEQSREGAETDRVSAELARVNAENERIRAEDGRVVAEASRGKFIGDIDSAISEIIRVQNDIIDGEIEKITSAPYPIGAIYLSVSDVTPAAIFGGTWEKLESRFLVGAGDGFSAGDTGGSVSVALSESQLPSNTIVKLRNNTSSNLSYTTDAVMDETITTSTSIVYDLYMPVGKRNTIGLDAYSQQPVSTLPPYLAVHMWKRIA